MKETWFSIDVETSGAVPGLYDLVSIGACVIRTDPGAIEDKRVFYEEVAPHGGLWDLEAAVVHAITQEHLKAEGTDPKVAITRFVDWVKHVAGDTRPVFCSWGTFDWMWMGYYLEKFGKKYVVPFGPNSLDLKSYYLGLTHSTYWRKCQKRHMPKEDLRGAHTHNALDDAIEQAQMVEGWIKKYPWIDPYGDE
jgi:DNA polymerase III epsilon subunit-like protein